MTRAIFGGAAVFGAALLAVACSPAQPPDDGCETTGCSSTQVCNTTTHACDALPACTADGDCSGGGRCVDGTCSSCTTNMVCTAALTSCDFTTQGCAVCAGPADCGGAFPLCGSGSCVQCQTTSDCAAAGLQPYCSGGRCGSCNGDHPCDVGACLGGVCRTTSCYNDSECGGAEPFCVDGRYCGQCAVGSDCGPGEGCDLGACRPALPGDSCNNPIPIALVGGSAILEGKGGGAYSAEALSSFGTEQDLYYQVTVTQEGALDVDVEVLNSYDYTSTRIQILAEDPCRPGVLGLGYNSLHGVFVVPGTYWIRLVRDWSMPPFRLRVATSAATRVEGNSCLKPKPLAVPLTGGADLSFTADFTGMAPAVAEDICDFPTDLPDLIYTFTLGEKSYVAVTATPLDADSQVVIEVTTDLCRDERTYCPSVPGGPLLPGTYALRLHLISGTGATIRVQVHPYAKNNTCETALPITFVNDQATIQGNGGYADPAIAGCNGSSTKALHYTLSTVGMGARSIRFKFLQTTQPAYANLSLGCRTSGQRAAFCGDAFDELTYVPEGVYDLDVSWGTDFTLEITLGPPYPPPANDTCASPEELTLVSNDFSVTGDTRGAKDDQSNYCSGGSSTQARDVVYHLAIPSKGAVRATVTPTSSGFDPTIVVSNSSWCASSGTCSNATGPDGAESVFLKLSFAAPGAYVTVDGWNSTAGSFTLAGTFIPTPANDLCATPQAIATGATVTGSMAPAFYDGGGRCSSASGADLFYAYTASANGTVTATLVPSGFDGTLGVNSGCDNFATCLGTANVTGLDGTETVTWSAQRNTTYVIAVSSSSGIGEGTFTLTVGP